MTSLASHQSAVTTKMLLLGDNGCLSGDTIVSVQRGDKPRKIRLDTLYTRVNANLRGNHYDTFVLADLGGFVGMAKMKAVVQSGLKQVFQLNTAKHSILATADHKFSTSKGWKPLSDLRVDDLVATWRGKRDKDEGPVQGPGKGAYSTGLVTIYSIPYHPFGQDNWVAGRNYKRYPRSRIVLEAAMNGLSQQEFISILRTSPETAATLQYITADVDVHHLDGNYANDDIMNLQIISKLEHLAEHSQDRIAGTKNITFEEITSCFPMPDPIMTYDIMMEAEPHNFIADGFVVHNSGKTGALASLAQAGYNLRILDLDNGLDILANLLKDPKSRYGREALARVMFETVTDSMQNVAGKLVPKSATVWQRMTALLNKWPDCGPVSTWTTNDILVIDSLSMLANAAMNFVLSMNARLGQQPRQSDWYQGQQMLESLCQMLFDEGIKCNIIVNCHIVYIGEDTNLERGYPATLGKAFSPKIGSYFNTILMAKTIGRGASAKHSILTRTQGVVELKNSSPNTVLAEYPLETGLADYFKAVRGASPSSSAGTIVPVATSNSISTSTPTSTVA